MLFFSFYSGFVDLLRRLGGFSASAFLNFLEEGNLIGTLAFLPFNSFAGLDHIFLHNNKFLFMSVIIQNGPPL